MHAYIAILIHCMIMNMVLQLMASECSYKRPELCQKGPVRVVSIIITFLHGSGTSVV